MVAVRCISRAPSPASLASQLPQWCMGPVGASLLAMVAVRCISRAPSPASLASQLPQWRMGPVGASLLAIVAVRCISRVPSPASLASQLPQVPHPPGTPQPCGSQLAGDGSGALYQASPVAGIAGKPAPTSASPSWNTPTLWEPAPTKLTISLIPACEIHFAAQCLTRLERPQVVDKQLHHQRRRCRRRAMTGQQQTPGRPEWMLGR